MRLFNLSHIIFVTIFIFSTFTNGQKLKTIPVQFKCSFLPLTPVKDLPSELRYTAKETYIDENGKTKVHIAHSGGHNHGERDIFYKSFLRLGTIGGFVIKNYWDSTSYLTSRLHVEIGHLDLRTKEVVKNGNLPDGRPAFRYKMVFKVPIDLTLYDAYGNEVYSRNSNDTSFTYYFPGSYKPTSSLKGYASDAELETAYQQNRYNFLRFIKDQIFEIWLDETKQIITSRFKSRRSDMVIDLYRIKDKKNDKYTDIDLVLDKMDTVFNRYKAEYMNATTNNWHASYYKNEFTAIAKEWLTILNNDIALKESGQENRFDTEMAYAMYKNYLWSEFFSGNMQMVVEECKKLEQARIEEPMIYGGLDFEIILRIATDYFARFNANPGAFNFD